MTRMNRIALTAAASFTTLALVTAANAAVIVDPTLVTGADAIDPAGSQTIDSRPGQTQTTGMVTNNRTAEVNFITEADLEARTDFAGAIQDLGVGFSTTTNIIQFTDATLPDIRITQTGGTTGSNINNSARVTSGTAGLGANGNSVNFLFEFGENSGTDPFVLGKVVDAVGFTIGNARGTQQSTFTVTFMNSVGGILSTQTLVGADESGTGTSGGIEGFFSFAGDGTLANGLASISVTRTGGANISSTIDDFGFTTVIPIPEPASLALLGLGGLMLVGRRRRA